MSWDRNDGVGRRGGGGWRVQETGHAWLSEGQRESPRAWGMVSKGSVEVRAGRPAEEGECFPRVMSSAQRLEMGCGPLPTPRGSPTQGEKEEEKQSAFWCDENSLECLEERIGVRG